MSSGLLSRRVFLRGAAAAGTGLLAAACQPKIVEVEKVITQVVKEEVIVQGTPEVIEKVVEKEITAVAPAPLEGKVVVWSYPNTEDDLAIIFDPLNAAFNREYPNIKVEVDVQPWRERREKLYAAAAAGAPPDIWWADSDTLLAYAAKGVARPLEDVIEPELLADINERNIRMGTHDGHLLIAANRIHIDGPGHNGTLMAESGFDAQEGVSTWDELLAMCETAKSKDYYGDFINTFEWQDWLVWLRQSGGKVYSDDGTQVHPRDVGQAFRRGLCA